MKKQHKLCFYPPQTSTRHLKTQELGGKHHDGALAYNYSELNHIQTTSSGINKSINSEPQVIENSEKVEKTCWKTG